MDYRFKIPSDIKNISPLLMKLKNKWADTGIDEDTIFSLNLACEEALVNAVKYGNKSQSHLTVDLICRIFDTHIEIEISDKGEGFDYNNLPNPIYDENVSTPGGRGIFLMKNFMDTVEFLENGSKIKMTKFIKQKENTMEMLKEIQGEVAICKPQGKINIDNSSQLRSLFDNLIKEGKQKFIVDFSSLKYIDSSGLATLIEMVQRLKKQNGDLRVCSLSQKVKSIFEITRLNTFFSIHEDLENALRDF